MRRTVVMMAKAPVAGKAKTRLAADIGTERAVALAKSFIQDLSKLLSELDAEGVVAWAGDERHPAFDDARALGLRFRQQGEGDLGARLDAIARSEALHADEVYIIGSDSPSLGPLHFSEAFDALARAPVVLGPSFDGGYYLVGMRSSWFLEHDAPHPIFADIAWSTEDVLGQTLSQIQGVGALCELTRFCYDVDTADDLKLLRTHLLQHLRPSGLDVGAKTAILLSDYSKD